MKTFIGVDVGKLELHLSWCGERSSIPNQANDIKKWIKKNTSSSLAIWVYEPTGGYERTLKNTLLSLSIPQRPVHANHIRYYAKSKGILAKTDKVDAKVIEDYAELFQLETRELSETHQNLKALIDRRDQLVKLRKMEKNHRENTYHEPNKKSIADHIQYLDSEIGHIETLLAQGIDQDPELAQQRALYESVPSIGRVTANQLVINLPELITHDIKALAALVGVAPLNRDSGLYQGKRKIMGGRAKLRKALYMATITAIKRNSVIASFYQRLKAKGKPGKVALIAAMRKLLLILKSIAVRKTPWVENI